MKTNRGIILIAVYLVIAVLLILGAAFIGRSISEKNVAQKELESLQAFFIAEAGLDRGLVWLRSQASPPPGIAPFDPFGGAQTLGEGSYTVTIDPDDDNPGEYIKKYKIISQGLVGEVAVPKATRKIINVKQLDSFARRLYFTDNEHFTWYGWKVSVWFITNDYLDGPTHSNSHLHISGDPLFAGPVSTTDNFISYMHGGPPMDNPVFQQGIQLGVEPYPMPSKALDLRTAAAEKGLRLSGTTTVTLRPNGTMDITNADKGWVNENMSLPDNGTLFVEGGNLYIGGVLKGELSVGSESNVVVTDNITYSRDARVNPKSPDKLGIIAEREVVVSKDAPYDLEIDASIMAMGSSFIVENWWSGLKGTLSVYGGIIQDERGPVGTFNPSTNQKASGYLKNYRYDSRLATSPPPYFPITGDYVSLSWEEE